MSGPPKRSLGVVAAALVAFSIASIAPGGAGPPARAQALGEESPPDEERAVPDYDGRGEDPTTAGEVLLWVPRVVLYPAYFVAEYVVRLPLGALLTWIEEERVAERVVSFLTFGPEGRSGILPTAFYEFSFRPSVGLYFFSDGVFAENDAFRVHFAWGGSGWWRFTVRERLPLADEAEVEGEALDSEIALAFVLDYRPDHIFHGFGPRSDERVTRFAWHQLGGSVGGDFALRGQSRAAVSLEVRRNDFGEGDVDDDDERSLPDAFGAGGVPGFARGYTLGALSMGLALDSRPPRPQPGTGVRLLLDGTVGLDLADPEASFLRYGGELGLFLDVTGRNRVLALRQYVGLLERIGGGAVPFTELFVLGGNHHLRGFRPGRFYGASAFVTSLQYTAPIWVFVDSVFFVDVGNVFGENLNGLALGDLTMSFGAGLRSNGDRDAAFELLVGAGTYRFDDPRFFEVEEVRFLVGVTRGF